MTAVPFQVRAEGITERLGDIVLQCAGNPGGLIVGNFSVTLPVSVTNRVSTNNLATDAQISLDYGLGFTPAAFSGLVSGNTISFNGVTINIPPSGNFNIRISNIRGYVHALGNGGSIPVLANLSVPLQINQSQLIVAYVSPGLYSTFYSSGVSCTGSVLPGTLNLPSLFAQRTVYFSTRLTEGFGNAFAVKGTGDDSGTRFVVNYSGFPSSSRLFVPDLVAGSDATTPSSGGDLGSPQAIGQYTPGSGTLLLARVTGADANGAGGTALALPTGNTAVSLNSVSEVSLTGGAGYAVYEVVDSNPAIVESAQFPTFLGLASVSAPAVAQENVTIAPVSNVFTASTSAPVPRFVAGDPVSDCKLMGDCAAAYFPHLVVPTSSIQLTGISGGAMTSLAGYIPVQNQGGGEMNWTATINYANNSGWIQLDQSEGAVRVFAKPGTLPAGTYQASIVIDAGPLAGSATIPVTLTIQAAPAAPVPPSPAVAKVVNAATFDITPLVAGSLATLQGSNFSGKAIAVTFDGINANLLYTGDTQINLQVPATLGSKSTATLVVTVDGRSSSPATVQLTPAWPSVFAHGVRNQDFSENTATSAAALGAVLQIFATGIPSGTPVSVKIGDRSGLVPVYAGDAPGLAGLQQVNVVVPSDLNTPSPQLSICAGTGAQQVCSAGYSLAVLLR